MPVGFGTWIVPTIDAYRRSRRSRRALSPTCTSIDRLSCRWSIGTVPASAAASVGSAPFTGRITSNDPVPRPRANDTSPAESASPPCSRMSIQAIPGWLAAAFAWSTVHGLFALPSKIVACMRGV